MAKVFVFVSVAVAWERQGLVVLVVA